MSGYHLRERSPKHWAIVIDDKDRVTGKRKRRWHSFVGTKAGAKIRRHSSSPSGKMASGSSLRK